MPMLSFSGETSLGPFWKLILDEVKTRTCRTPRKIRIMNRDPLYLYWKVRVPVAKKPIHHIGDADCVNVVQRYYREFAYDTEHALVEGFNDIYEMQEWFGVPLVYGNTIYDVIDWKLKK